MADALHGCPSCGSTETPKLVIRGSGLCEPGVSHVCRSCGSEWANRQLISEAS